MTTMASKTTRLTVVYSNVYSDADQRKRRFIDRERGLVMFTNEARVWDVVEIPQSRMATGTLRPPARDIRDNWNPPGGGGGGGGRVDQSAMLTSYRVYD